MDNFWIATLSGIISGIISGLAVLGLTSIFVGGPPAPSAAPAAAPAPPPSPPPAAQPRPPRPRPSPGASPTADDYWPLIAAALVGLALALLYVVVYPYVIGFLIGLGAGLVLGYTWSFVSLRPLGRRQVPVVLSSVITLATMAVGITWMFTGPPWGGHSPAEIIGRIEQDFPQLDTGPLDRARATWDNAGDIIGSVSMEEVNVLLGQMVGVLVLTMLGGLSILALLRWWADRNYQNGRIRHQALGTWGAQLWARPATDMFLTVLLCAMALFMLSGALQELLTKAAVPLGG